MLGKYEFKQVVGKNENESHLSAENYRYCKFCLFKHIISMRFNFNKSMVALKRKKLELKTHTNVITMFWYRLNV